MATESRSSLSLLDYRPAAYAICNKHHCPECVKCINLVGACTVILDERMVKLSALWRELSDKQYSARKAENLIMQVPLATLRVSDVANGLGDIYVCAKGNRESYNSMLTTIKMFQVQKESPDHSVLIQNSLMLTTMMVRRS